MVGVTFSNTYVVYGNASSYELDLSKTTDSALSFLKSMTKEANNSTGIPLSSFNYLNRREYGLFYHVADPSTSVTYLLNYFILSNLKVNVTSFPTMTSSFPPAGIDYRATGDFLGFGSDSEGIVILSLFSFKHICVKATRYGQLWLLYSFTGFTT